MYIPTELTLYCPHLECLMWSNQLCSCHFDLSVSHPTDSFVVATSVLWYPFPHCKMSSLMVQCFIWCVIKIILSLLLSERLHSSAQRIIPRVSAQGQGFGWKGRHGTHFCQTKCELYSSKRFLKDNINSESELSCTGRTNLLALCSSLRTHRRDQVPCGGRRPGADICSFIREAVWIAYHASYSHSAVFIPKLLL